jgi:DNA repair protein RadC
MTPPSEYHQTSTDPVTRAIRSPDVTYAEFLICPNCSTQIPLAVEGLTWNVRSPRDVADRLLAKLGGLTREEMWVLTLSTKNAVIDSQCVYRGNVSASLVRIGELFSEAVRRHGAGILLVHNHPSGDPTPSPDDLHLTAEALAAGRLLDIQVLDHIVLGNGSYVSLRDRGIQFDRQHGR